MKKTGLYKSLAKKIDAQLANGNIPGRFAEDSGAVLDRREQRKRDQAQGLVSFACKLPAEMVKQLQALATTHEGGINGLVAETILKGLNKQV